jgi:hypothetical protein
MRSPTINPPADTWLSGRQACKLAGIVPNVLLRAAVVGHIRVLLVPGLPPKYHLGDVAKFARDKPPPVPRAKRAKKAGPKPKCLKCAEAEDVKKPRRSRTSEVSSLPQVDACDSETDETPLLKENVPSMSKSTSKVRSGQRNGKPKAKARSTK